MAVTYEDLSLPPVGNTLRYRRADGRTVTISVEGDLPDSITANSKTPTVVPLQLINPLQGRQAKPPAAVQEQPTTQDKLAIMDNEIVGGRVTIFVLLWGDFYNMHRSCIEALITSIPPSRYEIRVGAVQLGDQSKAYVNELLDRGVVSKAYWREDNPGKYKVMRQMFYDAATPITTKWLLWLDDDTICNRNRDWFQILVQKMVEHYAEGVRLIGPHQYWSLQPGQVSLIKAAANLPYTVDGQDYVIDWFKGRLFYDKHQREVPNGRIAHFATGSFWAMHTDAMRACQVPDPRLVHNGGDYWIGEQIHQGGFKLADYSNQKSLVNWSSCQRRGKSEKHPGTY